MLEWAEKTLVLRNIKMRQVPRHKRRNIDANMRDSIPLLDQHSLSFPPLNLYATRDDFRGAPSDYCTGSGPTGHLSPLPLAQSHQPVPSIPLHVYSGLDALATPDADSRRGSFGSAGPWPAGSTSSTTDFGEPSGFPFSPAQERDPYSSLEFSATVPEHLSQAGRSQVVQHGLSNPNVHLSKSPVPVVSEAGKRKRKADDTIDGSERPAKKRTPEQLEKRKLYARRFRHNQSDGIDDLRDALGKDKSFSTEKTIREALHRLREQAQRSERSDAIETDLRKQVKDLRTQAEGYKTQADDYKTQAEYYKTQAEYYETQAEDYKTQAEDYKTQAEDHRTRAEYLKSREEDLMVQLEVKIEEVLYWKDTSCKLFLPWIICYEE
ncbi:hypothetical protein BV25DRAFT_1916761 [Artomyces pyxidatus]|uniref:Uncharacterized protein n=1 Tax=Artomyces pyxidatus TaxID=48021 RepID=A0ACB8SZU3_9AGAM|nr:hypothetical protein BV25DRAFT_1916761 [Artomyces pyxidatus]